VIARRPVHVLELRSVRGTGGGPEKTILLGAAHADRRSVQVTVCYVRDRRDPVFHIDERAAGLGVDYTEIHERHSFDPGVWPQLAALIRSRAIDVIHSHDYKTNLLAWLAMARLQIRAMATSHGWTGHSGRERYVYYPLDKRLLRRLPLVVAVSSDIRRELVAHGVPAERVPVLLNGIDPSAFRRDHGRVASARERAGIQPGTFVVGAVGRLEPQKRFDLLIDAFARVRARLPRLRLMIAGEGSARGDLERCIRDAKLEGVCRLAGHVADVIEFHHAVDLFVQSSDYEGTPNAVLEAMSLETPVIATDVGGTSEVCRPDIDGLIVPPGDSACLAAALESALEDPAGCAARTAAARDRVERELSFERRLRALEQLYVELHSRGSCAAH
jgi:glycosyltransferase involved in cell wall biosynthesis